VVKKILLLIPLFAICCFLFPPLVRADCPASDYDCQITDLQRAIDALAPAHEKNKGDLMVLKKQVAALDSKLAVISKSLVTIEVNLTKRGRELETAKSVFEAKTSENYKRLRFFDPLAPFFFADSMSDFFRELTYRRRVVEENNRLVTDYLTELDKLKTDKANLEKTKLSLAAAKKTVGEKANFLQVEVDKVQTYINQVTAKQQELSALKAGGFSTSVGDTPGTLEPCSGAPGSSNFCDPGFRPAFAAFSFGAPHRTGMSQYGALGRAKSGQSAETILSAYYQGSTLVKDYPSPATIGVTGFGRISFEENYLLGIYEIPESWGDSGGYEALKAQAVAARTYALAVTNNGAGTICTTEACQVYKSALKSGKWAQAVRDTRGWVLKKDGALTKTYYASTSGGFTISQWGWSGIKDASGDWPSTSFEKIGGSPWFYKGWYKSRGGATCGRVSPWLTGVEMADILNAWKVVSQGGGDVSRVSPVGGCWGGNPYSQSELQNIGGFSSVNSVSIIYSNDGYTLKVNFGTNKGDVSIDGSELKKAFNLRAPGYIGIKSSLFNIEKL